VKAVRATGKDTAGSVARLDRLEQQGRALGYQVFRTKKGKRVAVAKQMPSATDLVTSVLDAETDYRVLSAVVHGHAWALIQLGLHEIGPGNSQVVGGHLREFGRFLPRVAVTWASVACGAALHRVHENRARLFGVGAEELNSAYDRFSKQIKGAAPSN
jgi:hypothetical protein